MMRRPAVQISARVAPKRGSEFAQIAALARQRRETFKCCFCSQVGPRKQPRFLAANSKDSFDAQLPI